jgi:hypothetical protein
MFADLVDRDNVRMIEASDGFGFDPKALQFFLTGQLAGQDHFQSDDSVQPGLSCSINHAHSAASDFLQQFIAGEITSPRGRQHLLQETAWAMAAGSVSWNGGAAVGALVGFVHRAIS